MKKLNRRQEIENLFIIDKCRVCKNNRKIENLEDIDYKDGIYPFPPMVDCQCVVKHRKFLALMIKSCMTIDQLGYVLCDYNSITVPKRQELPKKHTSSIVRKYCEDCQRTIDKGIGLYIQSSSSRIREIIGCSVLSAFIRSGYSARYYNFSDINDAIGELGYREKYTSTLAISKEFFNPDHFYVDVFEEKNDIVFVNGFDSSLLTSYRRGSFMKMYQTRRKNGLITILGSLDDYNDVVNLYDFENMISLQAGDMDVKHIQEKLTDVFLND